MSFRLSELPRWLRDFMPLILLMGLIFWFSSQSVLIEIEDEVEKKLFYKTAHMVVYAALAWLWWRALAPRRRATPSILGAVFIFTTLYGISDEIHQLFVPGRYGRVADVLFDASGALAMILLIRQVKWLRLFPETISLLMSEPEPILKTE